jgi:hypothetical protein
MPFWYSFFVLLVLLFCRVLHNRDWRVGIGADSCEGNVVDVPSSRWAYGTYTNVSGVMILTSEPIIVACPPGMCADNGQCAAGRVNTPSNILCGTCLPGWSSLLV